VIAQLIFILVFFAIMNRQVTSKSSYFLSWLIVKHIWTLNKQWNWM